MANLYAIQNLHEPKTKFRQFRYRYCMNVLSIEALSYIICMWLIHNLYLVFSSMSGLQKIFFLPAVLPNGLKIL